MPSPRVLILYNEPTLAENHPDAESEHDILCTVDYMSAILHEGGVHVSRLGIVDDPVAMIDGIRAYAPDAIFNLYEGPAKFGPAEAYMAGLLDLLRIPYTGCPCATLQLARSKPLCKHLFAGAGMRTARHFVIESLPAPPCPLAWPVIVKPGKEDGSVGITQKSVVDNAHDLTERVEYLLKEYGPPVIVEEFIVGRELTVSVWERDGQPTVLPYSEVLFVDQPGEARLWPIISFNAKWYPESLEYRATPTKTPAEVTPELNARMAAAAIQAFTLLGCRDYARIDFRVDANEQPYILEVNPNPCVSPLAAYAAALEAASIPHAEFIRSIVRATLRRGGKDHLADQISVATGKPMFMPTPGEIVAPATQERFQNWSCQPLQPLSGGQPGGDLLALLEAGESWTPEERTAAVAELTQINANHVTRVLRDPDGKLVAIAVAVLTDPANQVYKLRSLVVAREARKQHCGRFLFDGLVKEILHRQGRWLMAEVPSTPAGASLRQFLMRMGFTTTGAIPGFYKNVWDRILYGKLLVAHPPTPAI